MQYPPCANPNCSSYGSSHPNCHCHSSDFSKFAEGGEAEHFCNYGNKHDKNCQYFAEGGLSGQPVPDELIPEQYKNTNESLSGQPVPEELIPEQYKQNANGSLSGQPVPDELIPEQYKNTNESNEEKYGSTGQEILTAIEGGAQGFLGPVATLAEKGLNKLGVEGFTDEDIAGRAATNPWIHGGAEAAGFGAGLLTGTGEAALANKLGAKVAGKLIPKGTTALAKIGSNIIKGSIENAALQSGDEISKAMLGQGNPEAPVSAALANIGAAGILGGTLGGASGVLGASAAKLEKLSQEQLAGKYTNKIAGFGLGSELKAKNLSLTEAQQQAKHFLEEAINEGHIQPEEIDLKQLSSGIKAYYSFVEKAELSAAGAAVYTGSHGGPLGSIVSVLIEEKYIRPQIQKVIRSASKRFIGDDAVLYALGNGETTAIGQIVKWSNIIAKGTNKINKKIEDLFVPGSQQLLNETIKESDRQRVLDYIENGELNTQIQEELNKPNEDIPQFAEGGNVELSNIRSNNDIVPPLLSGTDAIATVYPDQASLAMQAKGRINGYLNQLRPQKIEVSKLPFDDDLNQSEQEKTYNRAIDLAVQPLMILNHVKDGSLTPEDMGHFIGLYPELHQHLSKKITERILQDQMEGKKPSYKTRQGLSLFMGTPMDSTFTQANIQAVQGIYMEQGKQNEAPIGNKKSTSTLSDVHNNYLTQDQARTQRQNKT